MFRNSRFTWLAAALVFVFASQTARSATILYQDYSEPILPAGENALTGPTSTNLQLFWGYQFTPTVSGQVGSVDVAVDGPSGPGTMTLQLYADDGAGHLGTLLDTMPVTSPVPDWTSPATLLNVQSASEPMLTAGDNYWLVASVSGSVNDEWVIPLLGGVSGNNVALSSYGTFYDAIRGVDGAFDIQGVPEPGAVALFASSGLAGCGALARRLRRR